MLISVYLTWFRMMYVVEGITSVPMNPEIESETPLCLFFRS